MISYSISVSSHSLSTDRRMSKESPMHKNLAIILVSLLLLSGAATLLSACNTTSGAGKDISATGHAITRSANENM
jgi:predicted small secreted protein